MDVYLFILVWLLVGPLIIGFSRRRRKIRVPGTSVLLDYYTDGVTMFPIDSGVFGGLHYNTIATAPMFNDPNQASLIYSVVLPFSSFVHLVGIPKKTGGVQLDPAGGNSLMEKVELEGNYDDYFNLYAEKGMQEDSRYTLNPKAMVFTIDFCQSFSWEIVDNQLYAIETNKTGAETATLADNINLFIKQIQPAIARPLTEQQLQEVEPYTEEYRDDLKCPICHSALKNETDYLVCPNGDGVLLKGTALTRLHAGQLEIPNALLKPSGQPANAITCPACGHQMEKVNYNGSKLIINSCAYCPYRWLSAADLLNSKDLVEHNTG